MGSGSRALALVAVLAACAPAVAVRAAPSSSALRVACGQKSFLVAFYPNGEAGERRPHLTLFTKRQTLGLIFPKQLSFARVSSRSSVRYDHRFCKKRTGATAPVLLRGA